MANRGDREADVWLSDEQLARVSRADEVDDLHSPIPTQMVSNGEHMPVPQTQEQKRVEVRIKEMADAAGKKLGMTRRKFLSTSGGIAAGFLAMNEVYGKFFDVQQEELLENEPFAGHSVPSDIFVFDDQLHMVRSSMAGPLMFRAFAEGPTAAAATSLFPTNPFQVPGQVDELGNAWAVLNPQVVGGEINESIYHLMGFVKDIFFDSQTTVGMLSNATLGVFPPNDANGRPPKNIQEAQAAASLTAAQTAAVRDYVNRISKSQRLLAHGQIYPGVPSLYFMEEQIEKNRPDSWKGYTVATSAKVDNDPESLMRMWRLDDEKIAYPTYALIAKHREQLREHPGFWNICIHKGFSPAPFDTPEWGNPTDIPKAAADWPQFNFIIYHSCYGGMTPFLWPQPDLDNIRTGKLRNGVPDIPWLTQFGQLCGGIRNVYAEIGSTFAGCVITFPTVCAHIMGQLLKYFGEDRILFGSDCSYYGSNQWQLEALWRFQIPDQMRHQYGYPELTPMAKRKILGLNSARLYRLSTDADVAPHGLYRPVPRDYDTRVPPSLKTLLEFPGFAGDALAQARALYQAEGPNPRHTRFGWVRTQA